MKKAAAFLLAACAAGLVNGTLPAGVDTSTFIDSTPADAITPDNVADVLAGFKN